MVVYSISVVDDRGLRHARIMASDELRHTYGHPPRVVAGLTDRAREMFAEAPSTSHHMVRLDPLARSMPVGAEPSMSEASDWEWILDDTIGDSPVLAPPHAPPPPDVATLPTGWSPLRGDAPEYQPSENNVKHAAGVAYALSVEANAKQSRKEATQAWKGWLRVGKHWKHAITIRAGAKKDKNPANGWTS